MVSLLGLHTAICTLWYLQGICLHLNEFNVRLQKVLISFSAVLSQRCATLIDKPFYYVTVIQTEFRILDEIDVIWPSSKKNGSDPQKTDPTPKKTDPTPKKTDPTPKKRIRPTNNITVSHVLCNDQKWWKKLKYLWCSFFNITSVNRFWSKYVQWLKIL